MAATWKVVGGADKGGILVREGKGTDSPATPERLSTGAVIWELALESDRLRYELLEGSGPPTGWVSTKIKGGELLQKLVEESPASAPVPPELVPLPLVPPLPSSKWLTKYKHGPEVRCRLLCAFGAGTDASAFAHWVPYVASRHPHLELVLLQPPGRGANRTVGLQSDARELARLFADELLALEAKAAGDGEGESVPWALFGYSVGATLMHTLAVELARRGHHILRLYAGGRAGSAICFIDPEEEKQKTVPDYLRWFARTFLPPVGVEKVDNMIEMDTKQTVTTSVRDMYVEDLKMGNSMSKVPAEPIACDIHVIASHGDRIWPASNSGTAGFACIPDYDDICDSWRSLTHGSVTSTKYHGVAHHALCAEPLLEVVCGDIRSLLAGKAGSP